MTVSIIALLAEKGVAVVRTFCIDTAFWVLWLREEFNLVNIESLVWILV